MSSAKSPQSASRLKISDSSKLIENSNPNLVNGSPLQKPGKSPAIKSAVKSKNFSPKIIPSQIGSPRNKIRDRKFVVAKKNSKNTAPSVTCKCQAKVSPNNQKCPCVAYENLRASQEEFFQKRCSIENLRDSEEMKNCSRAESGEEEEKNLVVETLETANGSLMNRSGNEDPEEFELSNELGTSKRRRNKLLEVTINDTPEPGSGRVMNLVKAFERFLSLPSSKDSKGSEANDSEENQKGMKWALPGLQPKVSETQTSPSSFNPSDLFFTSENLGMDSRVSSSLDSSQESFSFTSRDSGGDRRSRRNSSESSGTFGGKKWKKKKKKKQLKATSQLPFKLITEERGKNKEEVFIKKVHEMIMEEEKQRIPIAQGLPWTTDEPECLVKPLVKEITKPIDLKLHSELRAMERAEFDNHVAEKLIFIEQYKMERERQQKLAEEEELKRLRRELVPKAQPMPYFDRPFIPRRSVKNPTIPKEPKFNNPQQKKIKCMSWNDIQLLQPPTLKG